MLSRLNMMALRALRATLVVGAALCTLTPVLARADQQQAGPMQTSAAVQLSFSGQGQSPDGSFAFGGSGVVNSTGDLQLNLKVSQPSVHSVDIVSAQGTLYISLDGQPYQSIPLAQVTGSLPAGCVGAEAGGGLPSMLNPQSTPLLGSLFHQVGTQTINGVPTNHLQGHLDLGIIGPLLGPMIQQIMSACGIPGDSGVDPSMLQTALAGGALDLDVFMGQADNFPRRVQANLNIPSGPFQFTLQADLTPLASASPIAPPS